MDISYKMDRIVRYNFRRSQCDNEANKWWFLIVDDNRGISVKEGRIYSVFENVFNEARIIDGNYTGTGLRYKLLSFDSRKFPENFLLRRVGKRVIQDKRLYDRDDADGLEKYIASLR